MKAITYRWFFPKSEFLFTTVHWICKKQFWRSCQEIFAWLLIHFTYLQRSKKFFFFKNIFPKAWKALLTGMLKPLLPRVALCYRSKSRIDNKNLTFPKNVVQQKVLLDTLNSALQAMLKKFHQISAMFFAQIWRMMTKNFLLNVPVEASSKGLTNLLSFFCSQSPNLV